MTNNFHKECLPRDALCKSHNMRTERHTRAADIYRSCPSKLSRKELEDIYFALLESNMEMKRTLNSQQDKIKVLSTRLQRSMALNKGGTGKDKDCCKSKTLLNDQKDSLIELRKSNDRLADRIRILNMKLCSAKQFARKAPVQGANKGAFRNASLSALNTKNTIGNNTARTTPPVSHYDKEVITTHRSTKSVETETEHNDSYSSDKEDTTQNGNCNKTVCDKNKCRTVMDELKEKIVQLQRELSLSHSEYSSRISRLEGEVTALRLENSRVRARSDHQLRQAEDEQRQARDRIRAARGCNGDLEMQLAVEKSKVSELETQLKVAERSSLIARSIDKLVEANNSKRDSINSPEPRSQTRKPSSAPLGSRRTSDTLVPIELRRKSPVSTEIKGKLTPGPCDCDPNRHLESIKSKQYTSCATSYIQSQQDSCTSPKESNLTPKPEIFAMADPAKLPFPTNKPELGPKPENPVTAASSKIPTPVTKPELGPKPENPVTAASSKIPTPVTKAQVGRKPEMQMTTETSTASFSTTDSEFEPKQQTRDSKTGTRESISETREHKSETREPKSEIYEHKQQTRELKSGTRESISETREHKSETREPKSEIYEPKQQTRELKSGTRESKSETPKPKSETREPNRETYELRQQTRESISETHGPNREPYEHRQQTRESMSETRETKQTLEPKHQTLDPKPEIPTAATSTKIPVPITIPEFGPKPELPEPPAPTKIQSSIAKPKADDVPGKSKSKSPQSPQKPPPITDSKDDPTMILVLDDSGYTEPRTGYLMGLCEEDMHGATDMYLYKMNQELLKKIAELQNQLDLLMIANAGGKQNKADEPLSESTEKALVVVDPDDSEFNLNNKQSNGDSKESDLGACCGLKTCLCHNREHFYETKKDTKQINEEKGFKVSEIVDKVIDSSKDKKTRDVTETAPAKAPESTRNRNFETSSPNKEPSVKPQESPENTRRSSRTDTKPGKAADSNKFQIPGPIPTACPSYSTPKKRPQKKLPKKQISEEKSVTIKDIKNEPGKDRLKKPPGNVKDVCCQKTMTFDKPNECHEVVDTVSQTEEVKDLGEAINESAGNFLLKTLSQQSDEERREKIVKEKAIETPNTTNRYTQMEHEFDGFALCGASARVCSCRPSRRRDVSVFRSCSGTLRFRTAPAGLVLNTCVCEQHQIEAQQSAPSPPQPPPPCHYPQLPPASFVPFPCPAPFAPPVATCPQLPSTSYAQPHSSDQNIDNPSKKNFLDNADEIHTGYEEQQRRETFEFGRDLNNMSISTRMEKTVGKIFGKNNSVPEGEQNEASSSERRRYSHPMPQDSYELLESKRNRGTDQDPQNYEGSRRRTEESDEISRRQIEEIGQNSRRQTEEMGREAGTWVKRNEEKSFLTESSILLNGEEKLRATYLAQNGEVEESFDMMKKKKTQHKETRDQNTYNVPMVYDRSTSPDNTEREISSLTDLPDEKVKSPDLLSLGEEKATLTTTDTSYHTDDHYGSLSEGELPTDRRKSDPHKEKRVSIRGINSKYDLGPKTSTQRMEVALQSISEELAKCRQLLNSRRQPEGSGGAGGAGGPGGRLALRRADRRLAAPRRPAQFTLHIGSLVLSDQATLSSRDKSLMLTWKFYDQTATMVHMRPGRVVLFDFSAEYNGVFSEEFLQYMKHEQMPLIICEMNKQEEPFAICYLPLRDALLNINHRVDKSLALLPGPNLVQASCVMMGEELGVLDLWCQLRADVGLTRFLGPHHESPNPEAPLADEDSFQHLSQDNDIDVKPLYSKGKEAEASQRSFRRPTVNYNPSVDPQPVADSLMEKIKQERRDSKPNFNTIVSHMGQKESTSRWRTGPARLRRNSSILISNEIPSNIKSRDEMRAALQKRLQNSNEDRMNIDDTISIAQCSLASLKEPSKQQLTKLKWSNQMDDIAPVDSLQNVIVKTAQTPWRMSSVHKYEETPSNAEASETYSNFMRNGNGRRQSTTQPNAENYTNFIRTGGDGRSQSTTPPNTDNFIRTGVDGRRQSVTPHDADKRSKHSNGKGGDSINKLMEASKKTVKYTDTSEEPVGSSIDEQNPQCLDITVLWLALNEECEAMVNTGIKRLYVSYNFLGRTGADLETPMSLPKPKSYADKCYFNFRKKFYLHEYDMPALGHMARQRSGSHSSNSPRDCVVFTVISEPPEDPLGMASCEDVGYGYLYLGDILAYSGTSSSYTEVVPVREARGTAVCGVLAVRMRGLHVLRQARAIGHSHRDLTDM